MSLQYRILMPAIAVVLIAASPVAANEPKSVGDILAEAIAPCWTVDPTASWSQTSVTVAFDISPERLPVTNSIRVVADDGGPGADRAFRAARRAILICGREGFALAPGDYEIWRSIKMTFDARN